MRRYRFAAISLAAALTVAGVAFAQAVTNTSKLTVKVGPVVPPGSTSVKAGTKLHPRNAFINVTTTTDTVPAGGQPASTSKAVLYFARGFLFNGKLFKTCTKAVLDTTGPSGCPAGSSVGSGHATGKVPGPIPPEALTVKAFNGPLGKKIELYVKGTTPVSLAGTIEGTLKKLVAGPYGYSLTIPIPANFQAVANLPIALVLFQTRVSATRTILGKRVGYVQTNLCPKTRKWPFKAVFSFVNGTKNTATAKVACRT